MKLAIVPVSTPPGIQPGTISNPLLSPGLRSFSGLGFFQALVPSLVLLFLVIGVLVFFFTFIIGAIQWISSGGDKAGLESARGKIINALIGLTVLFSLFAIVKLIEFFFGIELLTLDIGSLKIQ